MCKTWKQTDLAEQLYMLFIKSIQLTTKNKYMALKDEVPFSDLPPEEIAGWALFAFEIERRLTIKIDSEISEKE